MLKVGIFILGLTGPYEVCLWIYMQSERSDGMFCDDIFGETPTGVRRAVSFIIMLSSVSIFHHFFLNFFFNLDMFLMVVNCVIFIFFFSSSY